MVCVSCLLGRWVSLSFQSAARRVVQGAGFVYFCLLQASRARDFLVLRALLEISVRALV